MIYVASNFLCKKCFLSLVSTSKYIELFSYGSFSFPHFKDHKSFMGYSIWDPGGGGMEKNPPHICIFRFKETWPWPCWKGVSQTPYIEAVRPPQGSVKLIFEKSINLVLLKRSHHKPIDCTNETRVINFWLMSISLRIRIRIHFFQNWRNPWIQLFPDTKIWEYNYFKSRYVH